MNPMQLTIFHQHIHNGQNIEIEYHVPSITKFVSHKYTLMKKRSILFSEGIDGEHHKLFLTVT